MKKIMTIIAAAMLVLALTGCAALGKGKTSGPKWNKKVTVDGTSITKTYRRFVKPLSVSRKVTDIKTTIAIDKEASKLTEGSSNVVVGLAIDFHSTGSGDSKVYDMVVIGFQPAGKKFYIEKYENVSAKENKSADTDVDEDTEEMGADGFDTDWNSMNGNGSDAYKSFYDSANATKWTKAVTLDKYVAQDWMAAPEGSYEDDEDEFEIYVQVKQPTKGTYEIYLGETKVATYSGTVLCTDAKDTDNLGKCWGGAAVYVNTPKGTKVVAKYKSDKSETTGLFADEEDF